jgi:hypothetical protein
MSSYPGKMTDQEARIRANNFGNWNIYHWLVDTMGWWQIISPMEEQSEWLPP